MADTKRSLAAVLALLADNIAKAISPQDLRDAVVSLSPSFGSMYFSTPAETSITDQSTPTKAAGTTTSVSLSGFDMPANNRLRYTGSPDRHMHIACSLSFTAAANNKLIGLSIAKNGNSLVHSEVRRLVSTGADEGATALHADVMLSTNEYLEVFVSNETDTANLTVQRGYLFAQGMII
jgi:hypothetical protein